MVCCCSVFSTSFLNSSVVMILTILFCNGNLHFSEAQSSTAATKVEEDTFSTVHTVDCNLKTQCFLDETLLDPLLNCTFTTHGDTNPPCYGHWTSTSSCFCNQPSYKISSVGATYWCNIDGTWTRDFYGLQCQAPCITDAGEKAIPRNSNAEISFTILHGDFVNYTCPDGYIGGGTQTVDCNDGVWEPHKRFTCSEIPTPTGSTSTQKVTRKGSDKMTTIPTTILEHVTSDAEKSLSTNRPPTSKAATTPLAATSLIPTTRLNKTTLVHTKQSMGTTTPTNDLLTSMDRTTSIYNTKETTRTTVYPSRVVTSTPDLTTLNPATFDGTTIEAVVSQNVTTARGDVTIVQTTNPSTTQSSTRRIDTTTDVHLSCFFERIFFSGVVLTFATTLSNSSAYSVELCGNDSTSANTPLARRKCTEGSWDDPSLFQCYSRQDVAEAIRNFASTNVMIENVEEIAWELALLTTQTEDLFKTEIYQVAETLQDIAETGSSSANVTQSVVGIVNNMMDVDDAESEANAYNFILSLERQISNVQKGSENFTEIQRNVGVKAIKVDPTATEAITVINVAPHDKNDPGGFNNDLSDENVLLFNEEEEVKWEDSTSSIHLPSEVFQLAKEANPDWNKISISFFIYRDSGLFRTNSKTKEDATLASGQEVISQVIAATVENFVVTNLSAEDSITTRFVTNNVAVNNTNLMSRRCVFWKVLEDDIEAGFWSTEGCEMISDSSDNSHTVCKCSHLTSFAVILKMESTTYKPIHSLDIITKIGTSVSVIGLTSCILTLALIKKSRQKQQTKIHINLYFCLIGFYVTFLTGDLVKGKTIHCKILASTTHYFCLTTVAWICAEAVNIYYLFIKHGRTKIKHFIHVACMLCYGLSMIPTITVFILDRTNDEDSYCFLHTGNVLHFGILLEILLVLIINMILFLLVVQRVVCRPHLSTQIQKKQEIMIRIQHLVVFWILLGLSWTFVFLLISSIWPASIVAIEILFCIFTSLQGIVLLLFTVVKNPDVRKCFKSTKWSCRKTDGYLMKNRKGSYAVSDLHSTIEHPNTRVESVYRNPAMATENELSEYNEDETYSTPSLAKSDVDGHILSDEGGRNDVTNPSSVAEIDKLKSEDIVLERDKDPESRRRFHQNVTRHSFKKENERPKKKVIFV